MTTAFFTEEACINCGVRFGVPSGFQEQRREDKRTFYCPNGHTMAYTKSTSQIEIERLQKLAQAQTERASSAEQRLANEIAKPWRCTSCPRRFAHASGLESHARRAHGSKGHFALPDAAGPDAHGDMGIRNNVVPIDKKKKKT